MDLCDLHLISWNVAGLKTTLEQLRRFGFAGFLNRHRADVLCLQEVKLSSKALSAGGGRQFDVEGFESFWCCNDGLGSQRQGLNGVCTFARAGLVLHADNAPLGCEELDGEGRCLLTDHGAFVVFNVYVPNSAGGRLPYKLRWLRALRHAMWRERSKGKAVLLAGDLNLKHRVLDSHWTCLGVRPAVLDLADAPEEVRQQLARWEQLFAALRQKWVEPLETRNSRNGQTFQKFGVWAQPLPPLGCSSSGDGQRVRLGPPVDSKEMAQLSFPLDGVGVDEDGQLLVAVPNPAYVLREPGEISLGELVEGFKKLAGVEVSPLTKQWLVERSWPSSPEIVRSWLEGVLSDGMVDSFAEFYPEAQERFTCWDQYRNRRHENEGSRIDYVLVDRAFFERHAAKGAGLDSRGLAPESPGAALAAATYGGLSQPSPFVGGGMPAMEEDEYFAQFRADKEGPSTGIVYTPQQLSDHVAVSIFLRNVPKPAPVARSAATQRCQPHLGAKRITDFFARKDQEVPPKRRAVAA